MESLITSYKQSKNLHHAYFLVGDTDEIFLKLKDFLEKSVGVKTSGNPDFWAGKFNTLTIDEARDIAQASERKGFVSNMSRSPLDIGHTGQLLKIFIIQADFITEEAQNALLKVFEEPTAGTHFFIISPQDILLPTLLSRVHTISMSKSMSKAGFDMDESILDLKLKNRLVKVKEITEAISDEEKTKQDAILLLNQIEKELHDNGVEKSAGSLKICQSARVSLYDRGAPIKMILENVMLSI